MFMFVRTFYVDFISLLSPFFSTFHFKELDRNFDAQSFTLSLNL